MTDGWSPRNEATFPLSNFYRHGWLVSGLLVCFFAVGFVGHVLAGLRPLMIAITPGFLLVFGIFSLWPSLAQRGPRFWLWLGAAWLVTFSLEVAGVASGVIFGAYSYGSTLGFHVLGVPPVIGFNWIIVVLGAIRLLRRVPVNAIVSAIMVGMFCVVFDFIMEPVAVHNAYWSWELLTIPLRNYLAWFSIATLAALSWHLLFRLDTTTEPGLRWEPEDVLAVYVGIQALFFLGQRLVY